MRTRAGRRAESSASILGNQSVKSSSNVPSATHGIDAGKKVAGRKRDVITDILGLLLAVIVTAASVGDNTIGLARLDGAAAAYPVTKAGRMQDPPITYKARGLGRLSAAPDFLARSCNALSGCSQRSAARAH